MASQARGVYFLGCQQRGACHSEFGFCHFGAVGGTATQNLKVKGSRVLMSRHQLGKQADKHLGLSGVERVE